MYNVEHLGDNPVEMVTADQRGLPSLATSLRAKVSLGVILPVLLVAGIFTAIEYFHHREAMLTELSSLAAYTGSVVENNLRHQMLASDFDGLQGLLNTIGGNEDFRSVYLLDTSGQVIFAPFGRGVGRQMDNRAPECQPCHAFPVEQRPTSIVVTTSGGHRVFRSMEPIENSPDCAQCHEASGPLIGMLLIDINVAPFMDTLADHLKENLLLWLGVIFTTVLVANLVLDRFVLRRLGKMVTAIAGLGEGRAPDRLSENPQDEIGQLVKAFNAMSDRVEKREAENRSLSENLQRQSKQRGQLLKRVITAQEDERKRVARELHDDLGQTLTGLAMKAQAAERFVASDSERAVQQLQHMRAIITDATEQMYEIILDLRPSVLDDLGLVPALRAFADRVVPNDDLIFTLDAQAFDRRLPAEVETALFRAFQEALANTVRHAQATRVRVTLACQNGTFEGEILDDGQGFDLKTIEINGQGPRGLGLLGMQERIVQCGGILLIDTAPGQGTRVYIRVPVEELSCG